MPTTSPCETARLPPSASKISGRHGLHGRYRVLALSNVYRHIRFRIDRYQWPREVCKTFMRRFDLDPRLHNFNKLARWFGPKSAFEIRSIPFKELFYLPKSSNFKFKIG